MTEQEIIKIRKKQECIYQALNKKYESTKSSKEPFTFWLTTTNNNIKYQWRFKRGKETTKKPYTGIGIVQYGTRSNVQLLQFECDKDFKEISLVIDNRNEEEDQKKLIRFSGKKGKTINSSDIQNFYNYLTEYLKNRTQNISDMGEDKIADNLYEEYKELFKKIKDYDSQYKTNFYEILKITNDTFESKRNHSNEKMKKTLEDIFNNSSVNPSTESSANPHQQGNGSQDNKPLNMILYGPPGTGKTYNTVNKALKIVLSKDEYEQLEKDAKKKPNLDDRRNVFTKRFKELKNEGRIVFTTFHQSMSYEEFVEGIKPIPTTDGKNVIYKVMPGIFKQICEEAIKPENKNNNYVLIIDEINRGNVSQIFGELITLIEEDKRLGNKEEITIKLPYSSTTKQNDNKQGIKKEEEFGVPNNLYIIGTMNTADRSVEALDTALRRRFSFEEMMPKYTDEEAQGIECKIEIGGEKFKLSDMLWTINQRIEVLKGREQQIGHSNLMKCRTAEDLKLAFKDKIVPLLQEYFYGDYSQIALVLGEGFVKKETDEVKFAISDNAPENSTRYNLLTDEEWKQERFNLQDALEKMKIQECPLSKAQPTATSDEVNNESGQDNTPI